MRHILQYYKYKYLRSYHCARYTNNNVLWDAMDVHRVDRPVCGLSLHKLTRNFVRPGDSDKMSTKCLKIIHFTKSRSLAWSLQPETPLTFNAVYLLWHCTVGRLSSLHRLHLPGKVGQCSATANEWWVECKPSSKGSKYYNAFLK